MACMTSAPRGALVECEEEMNIFPLFNCYIDKTSIIDVTELGLLVGTFVYENYNDRINVPRRHAELMRQTRSAIYIDNSNIDEDSQEMANLTCVAYRISSLCRSPIIGYKITTNRTNEITGADELWRRMGYAEGGFSTREDITQDKLDATRATLLRLIEFRSLSNRTRNAIYFLYLAMTGDHWAEIIIDYMVALEAILSRDDQGGETRTICQRASNYLSDRGVDYDVVKYIYDARSLITHGKIDAKDPGLNLDIVAWAEMICLSLFNKLLLSDDYLEFGDNRRGEFVTRLD